MNIKHWKFHCREFFIIWREPNRYLSRGEYERVPIFMKIIMLRRREIHNLSTIQAIWKWRLEFPNWRL
jgi:hypothetical protein